MPGSENSTDSPKVNENNSKEFHYLDVKYKVKFI